MASIQVRVHSPSTLASRARPHSVQGSAGRAGTRTAWEQPREELIGCGQGQLALGSAVQQITGGFASRDGATEE